MISINKSWDKSFKRFSEIDLVRRNCCEDIKWKLNKWLTNNYLYYRGLAWCRLYFDSSTGSLVCWIAKKNWMIQLNFLQQWVIGKNFSTSKPDIKFRHQLFLEMTWDNFANHSIKNLKFSDILSFIVLRSFFKK